MLLSLATLVVLLGVAPGESPVRAVEPSAATETPQVVAPSKPVDAGPSFGIDDALAAMDGAHPLLAAAEQDVHAAEGDARDAGLWRNPTLDVLYTKSPGFTTYDPRRGYGQIWAAQDLELTGAPRARRRAGRRQAAALRADRGALRLQLATAVVGAMLELRAALDRVAVLRETAAAFDEAERVMVARVDAGAAPKYHATRIQLAAAHAAADVEVAQAEVERARAEMIEAIGPGFTRLRGDPALDLQRSLASTGGSAASVRDHPAAQASRLRAEAADLQIAATRRGVWPGFQVSLGVAFGAGYDPTRSRSQLDLFGGVTVPLPAVDRGQGAIPAARARSRAATRRADAVVAALDNPLATLTRTAAARRDAAAAFERRASPPAALALGEGTAGYRDGKLTILELVDAYESQRDYALRRIDLAADARAAELEVLVRAGNLPR